MPLLPHHLREQLLHYETRLVQQSPLRRILTPYRSSQLMVLAELLEGDWCDTSEAMSLRLSRVYGQLHRASNRFDNKADKLVYHCGRFSQLLQQCHEHINFTFSHEYIAQHHGTSDASAENARAVCHDMEDRRDGLPPDIAQLLSRFRRYQACNTNDELKPVQPG